MADGFARVDPTEPPAAWQRREKGVCGDAAAAVKMVVTVKTTIDAVCRRSIGAGWGIRPGGS